ncbi:MAG TPA: hypothetical protein HA262_08170 [Methanosarcina sp.]|nr:hypothetical protein [Methanosarcina sp.]
MNSYYYEHCENLKVLEKAISSVEVTLKYSIRKEETIKVDVYTKILAFLVNSWTEVRIIKLIYEINAFTEDEIKTVIGSGSLEKRWKKTLEIAYYKSFQNDASNPINKNRYDSLIDIITEHLKSSAEVRNRLAHGQWKYAFNNKLLDINQDLTRMINDDNYLKISLRYKIFKDLSQMIHNLAVSTPTFKRDFDCIYNRITEKQQQLHNKKYEDFANFLISKEMKYKQSKKESKT